MGFAARVRWGYYGRGRTVGVQTVKKALAAVSQTFDMERTQRHRNSAMFGGKRMPKLVVQLNGMRAGNKPLARKLAVPIDMVDWMRENMVKDACQQAIARLCNTTFFYLLRVGEYTVMAKKCTQTTQF